MDFRLHSQMNTRLTKVFAEAHHNYMDMNGIDGFKFVSDRPHSPCYYLYTLYSISILDRIEVIFMIEIISVSSFILMNSGNLFADVHTQTHNT
jgi:hypothetical protein